MELELENYSKKDSNCFENYCARINKITFILSLILFLIYSFIIENREDFQNENIYNASIIKTEIEYQKEKTKEKEIKEEIETKKDTESINKSEMKKEYISTPTLCLCVIAKRENRYIREFIEFYKKMKVDKIFLYDNNDKDGESFEEVISDYIKDGYVNITNFRGFKSAQVKAYQRLLYET